jgi:hypothetical protein
MARSIEPTEHDHQVQIFHHARAMTRYDLRWSLLFSIPNAGGFVGGYKKNIGRVMGMKAEGVKPGVPDIFLPVPSGPYCGLFIELKRTRGGTVSPEQRAWIKALQLYGYAAQVCKGAQQAIDLIETYLKLGE